MKKIGLGLVLMNFLAAFTPVFASSAADQLLPLLNNVSSMKADFTQTIFDNHDRAVQKSVGTLALSRPGKFRWDVKKPMPQLIIANQSRLWIYDPDLEQVTIRSFKAASSDTPALLLSHPDAKLNQDYVVTTIQRKPASLQWFSLKPRNPDNLFEEVQLGFKAAQISEMRLVDHLGHTTQIEFTNIQTNPSLSPALFVFKAPNSQVDVIDETKQ
jgi:outer membrane lipoprotein carrier protein